MDLFTEIQYLFCSIEHENMEHSLRMDKLRELINKSYKETLNYGVLLGLQESKKITEELIKLRKETK